MEIIPLLSKERKTMHYFYRAKQSILVLGDIACYFFGLWLAVSLRNFTFGFSTELQQLTPLFSLLFLFWITINFINGLYDLDRLHNSFRFYRRLFEACILSLFVGVLFFYLISYTTITPKTILVLTTGMGYGLSTCWRFIYNKFLGKQTLQTRVLFVGFTPEVKELITLMRAAPEKGYSPMAVIDPDPQNKGSHETTIDTYRTLKTIRPAITNHKINLVVIAPHLRQDGDALRELYELLFWSVQITNLPSIYEMFTGRIPPSTFSEAWFLDHLKNKEQPIYGRLRLLVDIFFALCIGAVFILFLPFIASLIKFTSKGPVFISQSRVGKDGKIFQLYKFRSMYALSADGSAETDGAQFATKNDNRITWIGKFLRKTRIDEFPQVLNIFKGDLSLIGPRPERPEIVAKLEARMPYYSLRHIVKPGLTGWAAIHQHYTDTLETSLQKLQYDLFYIKNKSSLLDISIILRSVNVVMRMMGQ